MFGVVLRAVLVLACVALALMRPESAWLPALAGAFLVVGYFRSATVWLAWHAIWDGNHELASRRLRQVPRVDWLSPQSRAYYEWVSGEIALVGDDAMRALSRFRAAAAGRLRSNKDRALAWARVANAALSAGELAIYKDALATTRSLNPSPHVEALLRDLESSAPAA